MKKGQQALGMSVGMIFTIFLIIFFIVFAVYGIVKIMDLGGQINEGSFVKDLQTDIDKAWGADEVRGKIFAKKISSEIEKVCIVDTSTSARGNAVALYNEVKARQFNLFFYPSEAVKGTSSYKINHVDINTTTEFQNPFCFNNEDGEIKIKLTKGFYDALVVLENE